MKAKRQICSSCQNPLFRCLCDAVIKKTSPIKIIIFRDEKEKKHALNTVNILALNLENISIIDINPDAENEKLINEILAPYPSAFLVFPRATSISFPNEKLAKQPDAFVFLDGTWKKTKKIYFKSKALQSLSAIMFSGELKSLYTIRQTQMENSLSTIEAVSFLLNSYFETKNYDELLAPFKKLIQLQINQMGEEKFLSNYKKKESD